GDEVSPVDARGVHRDADGVVLPRSERDDALAQGASRAAGEPAAATVLVIALLVDAGAVALREPRRAGTGLGGARVGARAGAGATAAAARPGTARRSRTRPATRPRTVAS